MKQVVVGYLFLAAACGAERGVDQIPAVASVSGAICNQSTHLYVAGATVVLTEYDLHNTPLSQTTTETDDSGEFTIGPVAAGTAEIQVSAGTFSYKTTVTVGSKNVILPSPSGCSLPTGTITGQICDQAQGAWLAGATVSVSGPTGTIIAPQPTDDLGRFTLTGVPAGPRQVVANGGGMQLAYNVTVPPNGSVDLGVTDCVQPGLSNIQGQICLNAAGVWLQSATVTSPDTTHTATTDQNGVFVLRGLPPGTHQVVATKGAFTLNFTVTTTINQTTIMPEPECTQPDLPIAVVTGQWDAVQKILASLQFKNVTQYAGYPGDNDIHDLTSTVPQPWSDALLGSLSEISKYRIVFFNSGLDMSDDDLGAMGTPQRAQHLAVLQQYIAQGGFVYVSDWAYELLLDLSDNVVFLGNPMVAGKADVGLGGDSNPLPVAATVVDPGLVAALSAQTVPLTFQYTNFAVATTAGAQSKVYLQSDVPTVLSPPVTVPSAPLLFSFPVGEGRVVFTSIFANSASPATMSTIMNYLVSEL